MACMNGLEQSSMIKKDKRLDVLSSVLLLISSILLLIYGLIINWNKATRELIILNLKKHLRIL